MFKILVSDSLAQEGLDLLQQADDVQLEVKTGMSPEDLADYIQPFDALVIRSASKVTADVIAKAENLKVVGRAGVGVDNVDKKAATDRGIIVMNTPGGNTISTAEHTMSLMFALARNIPDAVQSMREGRWDRKKYTGVELFGKTLGIIGLGRIGTEVAKRAQSFGIQTIGYDPFTSDEIARSASIEPVTLEELYRQSDIITLHVPANDETRGMIGKDQIAMMKDGVRIINCARGGLFDDAAVRVALDAGKIAGVAVDVYPTEPPAADYPLLGHPHVVTTPHLGASTEEAQVNVAVDVVKQMLDALRGIEVRNAINMPYIDPKVMAVLKPYVVLADRLGAFVSQVFSEKTTAIRIAYSGDINNNNLEPLTTAVLRGFMEDRVDESVNFVNAQVLAKSYGLKFESTKQSEAYGYTNLITVTAESEKKSLQVSGTIFEGQYEQRIVVIDGCHIESPAEGLIIVLRNKDVPGVIGAVGSVLGNQGINISYMSFADIPQSGDAVATIKVSSAPSKEVLDQIKALEHVWDVHFVQLDQ